MKRIVLALIVSVTLTACSNTPKPDGFCSTSVNGQCLQEWRGGQKVSVGAVDTRYSGLVPDSGGFTGSVTITTFDYPKGIK